MSSKKTIGLEKKKQFCLNVILKSTHVVEYFAIDIEILLRCEVANDLNMSYLPSSLEGRQCLAT